MALAPLDRPPTPVLALVVVAVVVFVLLLATVAVGVLIDLLGLVLIAVAFAALGLIGLYLWRRGDMGRSGIR
ncbi:MAG: hypothetical protein ACFCVK_01570 [Acidimicrobiales bacterium]